MENAMVMVGGARAAGRRITLRLTALAAGLTLAFIAFVMFLGDRAEAQFGGLAQLICGILLALINSLPAFFGGFLNAFLGFFGCSISG